MAKLSGEKAASYFQRSYTAIDGLWFMKVEEKYGFEAALEVDGEVWKVMPKIQARALKPVVGKERGLEALCACLTTKFSLEDFCFKVRKEEGYLEIEIKKCPWLEIMVKSDRSHLAENVSGFICQVEHSAWACEFGDIEFEIGERMCDGSKRCLLKFEAHIS